MVPNKKHLIQQSNKKKKKTTANSVHKKKKNVAIQTNYLVVILKQMREN